LTTNLTWREKDISLIPNDVTEINFDTSPNHIVFNNPTSNPVYVAITSSVSPNYYEMLVPAGSTKMFARANGVNQIFVYHASVGIDVIRVVSFVEEFKATSIAQSSEVVNVSQLTGDMNILSLPSLPTGNKTIGDVTVNGGVSLTGATIPDIQAIPTRNAGITGFATASVTVQSTAKKLFTEASEMVGRKQLIIYPPSVGIIYWGTSTVTAGTGIPLTVGDAPLSFDFDPNSPLSIWVINDGTDRDIKVVESK
jgi:hypothetical protein